MNKITNKWRMTGLLDYIEEEVKCDELAQALEEMAQLLFQLQVGNKEQLARLALPIVRRIYVTGRPLPHINWLFNDFKQFYELQVANKKNIIFINESDFEKDICELYIKKYNTKPHDVELQIKYHDGTKQNVKVDWEIIDKMISLHNMSAIEQVYTETIKNSGIPKIKVHISELKFDSRNVTGGELIEEL